jgi:chemotaxis protein methyltransferase CheR
MAILATDLSTRVLAQASAGRYSAAQVGKVPPPLLSRYFDCVETRPQRVFRVSDPAHRLVHFARLNLMDQWPMKGPFDVIFCRNVMIYFDKLTQEKLIHRYWQLLRSGGLLFIGHSESLAGVHHQYAYVQPTIYQKP